MKMKTATRPKLKRPTPSTLEKWESFPTIHDDVAQVRLARAMGYPPSWRVVRNLIRVPVPEYLAKQMPSAAVEKLDNDNDNGVYMMTTVQDRIYAGDPASQPDGYYNHAAALLASSKLPWRPEYDDVIHDNNDDDYDDKDYCSTSHRNKGGQLKGREARFEEGDLVEVLYDEDEDAEPEWYEATVLKKIEYQDDIRYNIHYHVDDALQSNVREEKIRPSKKKPKKKKATPKKSGGGGRKKRAPPEEIVDIPETTPPPKKKRGRPSGSKNKKKKAVVEELPSSPEPAEEEEEDPPRQDYVLDEGDPPWRTSGHEHLSRKVRWTPPSEFASEAGVASEPCVGTVIAWIAENDVDSEGNPGFLCSRSGKPAPLFHAIFEEFEQDFEEWELDECFIEDED